MTFLNFVYKQRYNGWGRTFFFAFLLSLITSLSILGLLLREIDQYFEIINYSMVEFTVGFFIMSLIGGFIAYYVLNMPLGFVVNILVNGTTSARITFKEMYNMTMVAMLPYVFINGVTRVIIGYSFTEFIVSTSTSNSVGWGIKVLIDLLIIFILIVVVIKSSKSNKMTS